MVQVLVMLRKVYSVEWAEQPSSPQAGPQNRRRANDPCWTLPAWVRLELEGEPGVKIQGGRLCGAVEVEAHAQLTFRRMQLQHLGLEAEAAAAVSLQDVEVSGGFIHAGGLTMVNSSCDPHSGFEESRSFGFENMIMQNSSCARGGFAGKMFTASNSKFYHSQLEADHLAIVSSRLDKSSVAVHNFLTIDRTILTGFGIRGFSRPGSNRANNVDIKGCEMTGTYTIRLGRGWNISVQDSHLGHCEGACLSFQDTPNVSVSLRGSTMQTSLQIFNGKGWKVDMRDLTASEMRAPFLEFVHSTSSPDLDSSGRQSFLCRFEGA